MRAPTPRDIDLPRPERLFARVPKTTQDKIAFLAKRWGPVQPLSTADVVIKLVEEAFASM
jgi:hypothetical protein